MMNSVVSPRKRMTLTRVTRGIRPGADRIVLQGVEGVGKSTFASKFPSPVFISSEDGLRYLDVPRFPEAKTFSDVLDAVAAVAESDYKTLVLDSLDWVECLIWDHLCELYGWESIETPGYGKGYIAALSEWRRLLRMLDALRTLNGIEIISIAHVGTKNFANPLGDDYARYEGRLHPKCYGLIKDWCDMLLFANYISCGLSDAKSGSENEPCRRVLHTERSNAWDAKNRHNLPATIDLDFDAFQYARERGVGLLSASGLADEARRVVLSLPEPHRAEASAWLREVKNDRLRFSNRLAALRRRAQESASNASPRDEAHGGDA